MLPAGDADEVFADSAVASGLAGVLLATDPARVLRCGGRRFPVVGLTGPRSARLCGRAAEDRIMLVAACAIGGCAQAWWLG